MRLCSDEGGECVNQFLRTDFNEYICICVSVCDTQVCIFLAGLLDRADLYYSALKDVCKMVVFAVVHLKSKVICRCTENSELQN